MANQINQKNEKSTPTPTPAPIKLNKESSNQIKETQQNGKSNKIKEMAGQVGETLKKKSTSTKSNKNERNCQSKKRNIKFKCKFK